MMDEMVFRSSQKLESLQFQLGLIANEGKNAIQEYSTYSTSFLARLWNSSIPDQLREAIKELWLYIANVKNEIKHNITSNVHFLKIYENLLKLFGGKRYLYFGCIGFVCGGLVGFAIGSAIRKQPSAVHYMQAIQCNQYLGIEAVSVVENAVAPHECGSEDVLISVKATSVQTIDAQICNGYGRTLRWLLRVYNNHVKNDFPITIGRDCTGIVMDIGHRVTRLEIGDEVWATTPFWATGTMSQSVLIPQHKVARKPRSIGFEGACSLPYAGSTALSALTKAKLTENNSQFKRIFIQGGCTPVGCILIQILSLWGAHVTTTCHTRAMPVAKALGANDIIVLSDTTTKNKTSLNLNFNCHDVSKLLPKELEIRDRFDYIFNTKECGMENEEFLNYCNDNGIVISSLPPVLHSDSYGTFMTSLFWTYIRLKCFLQKMYGCKIGYFDETHMCYVTLDKLSEFVDKGNLQTVVDKVYHPSEIETALHHIQADHSIGSTVITFR